MEGAPEDDVRKTVPLDAERIAWRTERADRFSVIVDAADYFRALMDVIPKARHSIYFVGWDFDTRIDLDPRTEDEGVPQKFGEFLEKVASEKPELQFYILKWNLGTLRTLGRGSMPLQVFDLMTDENISIRMDHHHPVASAHHQKIVVIDDRLAFCGGIDVTAERWDTREHLDENPLRRRPTSGRTYGPWHDATTAVTGPLARALGDLARSRWEDATGEALTPPEPSPEIWPEGLPVMVENAEIHICRTVPRHGDRHERREVEEMTLALIRTAEKWLYVENQYFASREIADEIIKRLREPGGPEIVMINPETADGWLEEKVMGAARAGLLEEVRANDPEDRFRVYTPVAEKGTPIYVHSKVLISDHDTLRVGSSNFNNRSMGFDTECDLVLTTQGHEGREDIREAIRDLRVDLMAEHLGVEKEAVRARLNAEGGSLIRTIEAFMHEGRSLRPLEVRKPGPVSRALFANSNFLDPKRSAEWWRPGEAEPIRTDAAE